MVAAMGILQYILAIVFTKTGQGLGLVQAIEPGKGENFTGALIAAGRINLLLVITTIAEAAGLVVIACIDKLYN